MDDEINISPEDLQRLSPNEQRELQVFLQSEQQKSQIAKSKMLSVFPQFALCPQARLLISSPQAGFDTDTYNSFLRHPLLSRDLFQEMHHQLDNDGEVGRQGGDVYEQLCQSLV